MTDRPEQDDTPSLDDGTFEEALDAAEVFNELANEEAEPSGEEILDKEAFADEFELAAERRPAEPEGARPELVEGARPELVEGARPESVVETKLLEEVEEPHPARPPELQRRRELAEGEPAFETQPVVERAAGEHSIGELFKPVVKHSPPSRIRIEADSVGALFRRFIEQG